MSVDRYFTWVTICYRKQISEGRITGTHLSLREYCRKHHVSYQDYLSWALESKEAADLPGISGQDKTCPGSPSDFPSRYASLPDDKAPQEGLLYPVDFTSPADMVDSSLKNPTEVLSGVHIRFADGTTVYIQQGSAHQISSVINACKP